MVKTRRHFDQKARKRWSLARLFGHAPQEMDRDLLVGPIRGDLLGADQLADRARLLAKRQRSIVRRRFKPPRLLARLYSTRRVLDDAHQRLLSAVDNNLDVGPAGEWLLDNYHVVQEHIVEVTESLPRSFYRELPELTRGGLARYPRVYELVISLISHSEARIDNENVDRFVEAFQEVVPLSIGELWAIPAMLRLGLLESVRRMALRTVQHLDEAESADEWAQRIQSANEQGTEELTTTLREFISAGTPLTPVFVARFLSRLRGSTGSFPPLVWLESWIREEGLSAEEATARSTQRLALTQLMMANSITSLRTLAKMDWRTFVERQSGMEKVLREDPSGFYALQTFATRDHYRHVVERIAKNRPITEPEVARIAVDMARDATKRKVRDARREHVGYFLIDRGLQELEDATDFSPASGERLLRLVKRHPNVVYFGGILLGTAAALALLVWLGGPATMLALPLVIACALLPANDIAINVLNQLVTATLFPRLLPKLDLHENGIPADSRTVVVVPTLFPNVDAVTAAVEHLEVQFLANREAHLHFALLSDFTDAPTEHRPDDDAIVAAARESIDALNARYSGAREDVFHLFHRSRTWNPIQGVWMGWERKRGKLAAFNRFLRHTDTYAFSTIVGDVGKLRESRYVITLDADTVLPRDAAAALVGTISHPLNRAEYDEERGRVVEGYGIIQPRVGVLLPSAHRSMFAAIYSGHPGVDPYTTAVSDVYQDLYGEGSFTGKGIYDVDVFEHATRRRFPENALLSHDLIEGSYARAGLATDISLYDEYPSRYLTFTRRKHRWIRGDWQLLPWLGGSVPGRDGPEPNRLSALSRWKIFDNLRRSTTELAQLVFLVAGWTILPGSPVRWTFLALLAIAAPWIVSMVLAVLRVPLDKSWRVYYGAVGHDALTSIKQVGQAIAFLPHQAYVSIDGIMRTLVRMYITHRYMLEWTTASQAELGAKAGTHDVWRSMWPVVPIAAVIGALAASTTQHPWALAFVMLPLMLVWAASPMLASILSRRSTYDEYRLTLAQRKMVLRYALLHWRYFDELVGEDTNWLAPDNMQDVPARTVALRTSPTNIGLQLLSTVSACDLGFLSTAGMLTRLEQAFLSMERMSRFRGHLFNWYELSELRVLEPAYISTVDSGNLAGHLIALRQACLAMAAEPLNDARAWNAISTALGLAAENLRAYASAQSEADTPNVDVALRELRSAIGVLGTSIDSQSAESVQHAMVELRKVVPAGASDALRWVDWCTQRLDEMLSTGDAGEHDRLVARLETIAEHAYRWALNMDFRFLYDDVHELFSIGYQSATHQRDASFYDLLASEARLASFIAIAKDDVPVDHWFRLGRTLTSTSGETAMISWSGSMFEYLMPTLVMKSFPATLLDQTCHAAVRRQIAYGEEREVPWGVSESAYNLRDRHQTYQYHAFGVPDLALKRGLGRDLVIAPYATMLASVVDLPRSLDNLVAMERKGALGAYGFNDAIDYTRPQPGKRFAIVHSYMAHHIGMSMVALANLLQERVWQRRFHADPLVQSVELLLHERMPRRLLLREAQEVRPEEALPNPAMERSAVREFTNPDSPQPLIALLGNLPYTVMISHVGSGYSRYEDRAVNRWRADGTRDNYGQFCYVRDVSAKRTWSTAYQPTCATADWYRAMLATDRVTFHRADGDIETRTEVAVVPEDAAEVRSVIITNNSNSTREVELTSYGELVLAPMDADRAHPAFANLFVQTEWHEWCSALIATRRPRSASDPAVYCVHVVDATKEQVGTISYETDRARFIGRGRSTRDALAMEHDGDLSGNTGAVLDPIFSLRIRVSLPAGASASVAFTTLMASTHDKALELAGRYHDAHAAQRALDLSWTVAQIELRELNITPADAATFQDIAGYLMFGHAPVRPAVDTIQRNVGSQQRLWGTGISGDWPILLATIDSPEGLPTLRQLFAAHRYWRRRGITVDLVVLNTFSHSYIQELNARITEAMFTSSDSETIDKPGGVFVRRSDQLNADDLLMLQATARVHIGCDGRSLARILQSAVQQESATDGDDTSTHPAVVVPKWSREKSATRENRGGDGAAVLSSNQLAFANGYGGLAANGDYEISVIEGRRPPAPWVNVIANSQGGFIVSESGAGSMWAGNSYFYRVTPWHNDPVSDPVSEVLYLRDEHSGELWSATPAPIGAAGDYTVSHGAGFSSFSHAHGDISSLLTLGVAPDAAVKLSVLRLTNRGPSARRISVTAFVEWTLGMQREHTQHQVRTQFDRTSSTIFARNYYNAQFAEWCAFLSISEDATSYTADRTEFIGRNGTLANPAAMRVSKLGEAVGVGLDPCGAIQCMIDLPAGESRDIVVALGAAPTEADARTLVSRYATAPEGSDAVQATVSEWDKRLGVIQVQTPEPSFDAMVNQWTLYQALACRMWARSALYQSSGAYGFRDQLQDVMAFLYAEPMVARSHILRAAARQFLEGDVQHWWHPQSGRGVRTRFSDDLAWLPYVVHQYVSVTGDNAVLDEYVPFLSMRLLNADEHEVYDLPTVTDEHGSVYEHCLRALRKACTVGERGLPLMGSGDWNDGMNRVGVDGRGESVWLAWFLVATLRDFASHCEARKDSDVAADFRSRADAYVVAIESSAWDGAWYRRAFFDDGTPLGSHTSEECKIDSIAQSWSVISRAGQADRQQQAMESFETHLVRNDARLLMLLTPPFDRTPNDPGYIKGYLPGVRENGAQYTHAALWAVMATALRGEGTRAFELYQMLNPLTHTATAEGAELYKVEPYVIAADVYTAAGQLGRGGWTWYTGSASWMYRVALETMLGFEKRGDRLRMSPCIPAHWPEFGLTYRFGSSTYRVTVQNPELVSRGVRAVRVDGAAVEDQWIALTDDGAEHVVEVELGGMSGT